MTKETAEYSIASPSSGFTVSMGGSEEDTTSASKGSIEIDSDDLELDNENEDGDGQGTEGLDGEVDANVDGDADGDSEAGADADLGDFVADDPEVVSKFDAKYLSEDGSLDAEGVLSTEYFANLEKGIDGLNEATYEYLASKGITKATVKQIEAMAATNRDAAKQSVEAHDLKLFEIAGGPDKLSEALKWGKEGGYSKEQIDRFNKIAKGKDLEAKQEAVEALMSRYNRANPAPKPKLPARDATKGQGKVTSDVKPYASRQEMREIRNKLRDNDSKGWAMHNRRLAISKFE